LRSLIRPGTTSPEIQQFHGIIHQQALTRIPYSATILHIRGDETHNSRHTNNWSPANLMSNPNIVYVTDDSFEGDVLKSAKPVLVDYWAEWCGPCRMIAPILDEVSGEYSEKLKIAKLDVDDNHATSMKYGIRGVPTLMLFKDGNVVATHVGALTKSQLTAFIDSNI
jgi:thioredoxin 1